jgi:nucleoside recognition membrane protein YjiH
MLVTFFRFHMEDCKPTPSPFQSRVKLVATCTSPKVDATLYRELVGSLLYLIHTCLDLSFVVGLVSRYMQTPHEIHWKATKRILRYVGVQFSSGYITVQGGLLYWLVSLIQIGSMTLMIEILLQVMFSSLVQDLSLGPVRNNRLFLFLQQKQSTEHD